MRIEQVCTSPSLEHMSDRFKKKYQLEEYHSSSEPSIFFGCYSVPTIKRICTHGSLAVVVWGGTDAKLLLKHLKNTGKQTALGSWFQKLVQQNHVRHIAISEYIEKDLRGAGLEYKSIPITTVLPEKFKVCKPGRCLYSYGYTRRPAVYNAKLVEEVLSRLKNVQLVQGEIGTNNTILYDDMPTTYSKCFMGLRLTTHDGLPNTVVELGLMGIRCIYNGNLPNAVKWTGVDDIIDNVHKEQDRIGHLSKKIAQKMLEYISISDAWLDTSYWEENRPERNL